MLITDFWSAYQSVCAEDRQYCLVHLLRELEKVGDHNDSVEWQTFAKKLRRLLRDGIRLRKRDDFAPPPPSMPTKPSLPHQSKLQGVIKSIKENPSNFNYDRDNLLVERMTCPFRSAVYESLVPNRTLLLSLLGG